MTGNGSERRREKRLQYHWPVWFAEDFGDVLAQGQMFDLSSGGASFTCYSDACPAQGQYITTRFSIPHYGQDNSFDLESCMRSGFVCRIEDVNPFMKKVALQFAEPLHFKPGEQATESQKSNHKTVVSV
ncbi:MAG TPA: hypothetical protein DDW84_01090 [Phycisphaerales bacterium]|nr:MAG: hypothetical protein A2Y13_12620 [Planctomycetes bacterium GWC2_45_44]HBG77432.1 hypothetical protein [Phycisphaerales bacterium]HBR20596.1 hypothetical protein [Phycisphaerales bacterium]